MSESQNRKILKRLQAGGKVDPLMAFEKWAVMRLASRIKELRKAGHVIVTIPKKVKNRYGEICRTCDYKLMIGA